MIKNVIAASLAAFFPGALLAQAPNSTVLVNGLANPFKIARTAEGNLLVTEGGRATHAGRVSLVTQSGLRTTLLDGLPAAVTAEGVSGPTGIAVNSRTLYVAIGQGDTLVSGATAGTEVPNPKGPSSAIFSSILAVQFSADVDRVTAPFTFSAAHRDRLADGLEVTLDNGAGVTAAIEVLTDFRDFVPDARTITRASNPFGLALDPDGADTLWVSDAGMNAVWRVDTRTGRARILTRIAPIQNPLAGPPFMDPVPTSVRPHGGMLLVSCLTGFPFVAGQAQVVIVDPATGEVQPFIPHLSAAMDVLPIAAEGQFLTIEFSANMGAQNAPPGRLQLHQFSGSRVVAPALITPTSFAVDPGTGDIYVVELGPGRISVIKP
jgi:DNA-binding beta-propeller fold protein YncE